LRHGNMRRILEALTAWGMHSTLPEGQVARDARRSCLREETRQPFAEQSVCSQSHCTEKQLQGPRESAKPHRSRQLEIEGSISKFSRGTGCLRTYQVLDPGKGICARLRQSAWRQGCPEGLSRTLRSHQLRTHEGEEPARQLRHFSEHAVAVSLVEDRRLRAETLICLARVRLDGKAFVIDNDHPMRKLHTLSDSLASRSQKLKAFVSNCNSSIS
jgi:hypothetical protein